MSFGLGSAFGGFSLPTSTRQPRRTTSSGSFKEDQQQTRSTGPTPNDNLPNPSLGNWEGTNEREQRQNGASNGNGNGHGGGGGGGQPPSPAHQRSFSSILSPTLPNNQNTHSDYYNSQSPGGGDVLAKPFVYSREFLLSLYDDEKASKRPIELARHDIATKDEGGKPWALKEWREGEKELFATSIHPPTSRSTNLPNSQPRTSQLHRSESNSTSGTTTLDLSTLSTLPRDRDRPSASSLLSPRNSLTAGIGSTASSSLRNSANTTTSVAPARGGTLGTLGLTGGIGSLGGGMGIQGGVLGGIGASRPLISPGLGRRDSATSATSSTPAKDIWQGGRWRRSGTAEAEEEKRPSAFGARRYPTGDSLADTSIEERSATPSGNHNSAHDVPNSWDAEEDSTTDANQSKTDSSILSPDLTEQVSPQPQHNSSVDHSNTSTGPSYLNHQDSDLTPHASSILNSLSLDSDPLFASSPTRISAPPGLAPPAPLPEVMWQYRDPSGQVQGPFAASMMHDWYRQNFFTGDLKVKRIQEADYETLDNLVRRAGDQDTPFLSAPLQPTPSPLPVAAQWPLGGQSPLDQFTGVPFGGGEQQRQFGQSPFYEPSPNLFDPNQQQQQPQHQHQHQQQQQQQQFGFGGQDRTRTSSGLDPWGAPLPPANNNLDSRSFGAPAWNDANMFGGGRGGNFQQQQSHAPHQQQQNHQLFQQQQQQPQVHQQQNHHQNDPFGRSASLSTGGPYFDQSTQQLSPSAANPDWNQLNNNHVASPQLQHLAPPQPQQIQQQLQSSPVPVQQLAPIGQTAAWNSLGGQLPPRPQLLDDIGRLSSVVSPIGPPPIVSAPTPAAPQSQVAPLATTEATPTASTPAAPTPSAWGTVKPVEPRSDAFASPAVGQVPAAPAAVAPITISSISKSSATSKLRETTPVSTPVTTPAAAPAPSLPSSTSTKPAVVAPWVKDDEPTTPTGPSLRQIQEAEARQAEIRKTTERQAAARTQALAAVQAAQRAAAAEAETLPSSSTWATASPSSATKPNAAAPWATKVKAAAGGKSMKEIQEEEELRRKKAAQMAAQSSILAPGVRGYAGSIGQLASPKPAAGAPWTTVGVKPPVTVTPTVVRPVIPGGPAPVVRPASLPAKPTTVAAAPRSVVTAIIAPPSRPASRSNGVPIYDAESPPPPSSEFMKWCREALKGLTVPMDEFIQMLLSFPLDASADVLEIISDSVYANSSTLDGRRFANDYASRRKLDVAARYPSIVMSKGAPKIVGKPSSMAEALKAQQVPKAQEWNVKVAGSKKKGKK